MVISIHPPRVGWDREFKDMDVDVHNSIHPPRVGWDFLAGAPLPKPYFISIHPPRVGWDVTPTGLAASAALISIHPPRVGWDRERQDFEHIGLAFQSTHPVWGGTALYGRHHLLCSISIHPPRVGWDLQKCTRIFCTLSAINKLCSQTNDQPTRCVIVVTGFQVKNRYFPVRTCREWVCASASH